MLGVARVVAVVRGVGADGRAFSRSLDLLDRAEPVYLLLCAVFAVMVLARAFGESAWIRRSRSS
jgi:hypothetical protein